MPFNEGYGPGPSPFEGEPIDNLARRAMANLNNNGVGSDVRDMARRALDNMDGGGNDL
jgi:hypothetical protein